MNYYLYVFVYMCYRIFYLKEEFIFVYLYGYFSKNIVYKILLFVFILFVFIINV